MCLRSVMVIGASGWLGSSIVQGFLDHPKHFVVTVLAREAHQQDASKRAVLSVLEDHGARCIFVPDICCTADGIAELLRGIDMVVSTVGHHPDAIAMQHLFLEAAKLAGVKRFVPSTFGLDLKRIPPGVSMVWDNKRKFIEALMASGLDYTIIANGCFYETIFTPFFSFDPFEKKVHIKGDGEDDFWATSAQDVACWLPDVLLCPTSRNAQINLVGEVLSWNKAIRIFEEAAGEQFQVVRDTTKQLLAQICSQGDCWEAFPDRASLCISQGWFLPDDRPAWNVEHGRETTSVSMFAESLVHRRVPQLVAAALGGVSTPVSPTGQQTARCSNPILMESVMMDTFPMPFTLPVTEAVKRWATNTGWEILFGKEGALGVQEIITEDLLRLEKRLPGIEYL